MWIVRLALHRPRTIAVMALLIFLLGGLNILRMPKDIFPSIDVPVVAVIWSYGGLAPHEMDGRVVHQSEAAITTSVDNIEHVEATSLPGQGIIKVYLQPGTSVSAAITQIATTSQSVISSMPQGITPPSIIQYDASDVPIVQLVMSSDTEPISKIVDTVSTVIRPQLVTVRGAGFSPTLGGMSRLINVDLDTQAMTARGVTAQEVTAAIGKEDIILPAGDAKMGSRDYIVRLNNSPVAVKDFDSLPIKIVNGATIFVRDVAHVRNGNGIQVSMVRVNGKPAVLLTVLKNGTASTLDVVSRIKERLPQMRSLLPSDVKLDLMLDQSIFVRASIVGVVREALIAAGLTGLMILLFLGSWRSTITVAISIPLSIMASIAFMASLGQTLNTLTLGGLALAVGMLVDDATVEVENTTRNLGEGYPLYQAILHSAQQVALPAFTSTLSICIVFVPVIFLTGVAKSLFLPLAMAVVLAMLPSYLLSRTLVTTMMQALLGKELDLYQRTQGGAEARGDKARSNRGVIWDVHERFEKHFDKLRDIYHGMLVRALDHRPFTCLLLFCFFIGSAILLPFIGEDFFPKVDAGQMRLHVRVPPGTRLEETGKKFSAIEATIRQVIPARETDLIMDVLGQAGGSAYVRGTSSTIGAADGEIDVSLTPNHQSTWGYMAKVRSALGRQYPECSFAFQPADMPTQVLDFGTSAPIDIQVLGNYANTSKNYALAQSIMRKVSQVPGVVDCYIYQVQASPELRLTVDRTKALQMGVTQQNVAGNVLVSLSSSSLVAPSYYLDPVTGFEYTVAVQTKQYNVPSVDALLATPVANVSTLYPQDASTSAVDPTAGGQVLTAATQFNSNAVPVTSAPQPTSTQTPTVAGTISPSQASANLTIKPIGASTTAIPPSSPDESLSASGTSSVSSASPDESLSSSTSVTAQPAPGAPQSTAAPTVQNSSAGASVVSLSGAATPVFPGQTTPSPIGLSNTSLIGLSSSSATNAGITDTTAGSSQTSAGAPISTPTRPELLSNLATVGRDTTPQIVNSYNTLPVFDVYANVENRDLGGVTSDVQKLLSPFQKSAPRGTIITVNGQALTMQTSFVQLGLGLVFAIVLIYLLLTVNFESWVDPIVILMASPGALCGVLWGLFATRSTFNVPSLMGTIMSVGVATANSILLVTFANELRAEGKDAMEAALEAGFTRFRPVIMTALAMILGMLPMAVGMGDGGEQNAPLGRAVIGGLLVATCTTLIFVPLMYTVLKRSHHDNLNGSNATPPAEAGAAGPDVNRAKSSLARE